MTIMEMTAPKRDSVMWTSDASDLLCALGMLGVDEETVASVRGESERLTREEYDRGPRTRGDRLLDSFHLWGHAGMTREELARITPAEVDLDEPIQLPRPYVEGWHLMMAAARYEIDRKGLDLWKLRDDPAF
jgi:hypothetical protein